MMTIVLVTATTSLRAKRIVIAMKVKILEAQLQDKMEVETRDIT